VSVVCSTCNRVIGMMFDTEGSGKWLSSYSRPGLQYAKLRSGSERVPEPEVVTSSRLHGATGAPRVLWCDRDHDEHEVAMSALYGALRLSRTPGRLKRMAV
jgi:hypothetical protein